MDSLAQSPRHVLQYFDDVAHPLGLTRWRDGDGGVAEVQGGWGAGRGGADGGPVGFGDVHGLGVLRGEGGEGGGEVGEGGGGAVEGIKRKSKDVPISSLDVSGRCQSAKPCLLKGDVPAVLGLRISIKTAIAHLVSRR